MQIFLNALRQTVGKRISGLFPLRSRQTEAQVVSLSGLTVGLLATIILLIVWSTNPGAQGNSIIQFLAASAPRAPVSSSYNTFAIQPDDSASEALPEQGMVVFDMYAGAQQDIFALAPGTSSPLRLTNDSADDRQPAWRPDGRAVAFTSHRDGNWEIYILDTLTGDIQRLTFDLAYEGSPSWSPDGEWLAYEAYYEGNLDVYIIKADGSEGPYALTRNPAPDFSPAWGTSPGSRQLAYVSRRGGDQDIYVLSLDDPSEAQAQNITQTPHLDESGPAWGADGQLLSFTRADSGETLVYVIDLAQPGTEAAVMGRGFYADWGLQNRSVLYLTHYDQRTLLNLSQYDAWQQAETLYTLPGLVTSIHHTATSPDLSLYSQAESTANPASPAYSEDLAIEGSSGLDTPYSLIDLSPTGLAVSVPYLSDRVDASFRALRDHVDHAAGWDMLSNLDSMFWPLDRPVEPGQPERNWHKAGRAFDIYTPYSEATPAQIELVPEQLGAETYWRLYVRCAVQDGTLGEPLRQPPWDFSARFSGDVTAYENGGRFRNTIPSGYYIDFTEIAALYGWLPSPSHPSWRSNWPSILYWHYEKRDNLDWWDAMLEVHPERALNEAFSTSE